MPGIDDYVQAKDQLSQRLLARGIEGGVLGLRKVTTINAAAALAPRNVHAVGVGRKIVDGKTSTTRSVRIYVVQKLPESMIPAAHLLPKRLDGIAVDVIETPPAFLFAAKAKSVCTNNRKKKQRPVIGGISTAHYQVTAGTIAYFCNSTADTDDPDDVYVLSNNHVFANVNQGKAGDALYQPGPADGGTSTHRFAGLQRFVKIRTGGQSGNKVDAAIGKLLDNEDYLKKICSIGRITGTAAPVEEMKVRKHGRTTGYTEGRITDIAYDALIGMDPFDPGIVAKFVDQIRIDSISSRPVGLGGDSGSLIVTRKGVKAVGLYFAGPDSGSYGVANKIDAVLDELNIRLII